MFKPFKELQKALEENKRAAESLMKMAERCDKPICDIPIFHQNRIKHG